MPIKVIADDKGSVRAEIVQVLKAAIDIEVIGEAASFEETLKLVSVLGPDFVLLDLAAR